MMSISEYTEHATKDLRDEQLRHTCVEIINLLASTPNEELSLITFQTVAQYLRTNQVDDNMLRALSILRGCKPPALELRYMFIDDDDEYEIDSEVAQEAIRVGYLRDRHNQIVEDARDKLFPFFCISDDLADIKAAK